MAIIKGVAGKVSLNRILEYVTQFEKVKERLIEGINCNPDTALEDMSGTKDIYGKNDGRQYLHYVQSFAPGEDISSRKAMKMARELVSRDRIFDGYEVLLATHSDKEHVHTHIVVNSVSLENGHKLRLSKRDLQDMKDISDGICREHGLSITEKGRSFDGSRFEGPTAYSKEKYEALSKGKSDNTKSYLIDTMEAVKDAMERAGSRDDFIGFMKDSGYDTVWTEKRKHITFIDEQGNKMRDSNLSKTFNMDISKQKLEEFFEENKRMPELKEMERVDNTIVKSRGR